MEQKQKNAADFLVECLLEEGVEKLFTCSAVL